MLDSVVGLEVDANGETVDLNLTKDQLISVGFLAAKLAELQQTEHRDGLARAPSARARTHLNADQRRKQRRSNTMSSTEVSGIDSTNWDQSVSGFAPREASEIIGNTKTVSERDSRARAQADSERRVAEHDRERASGVGVSPTLDNPFGERLRQSELVGLQRNAEAAREIVHRLDQERDHLLSLEAGQRDDQLLGDAWNAALAKSKVPAVMVPAFEYDRSTASPSHPVARHRMLVERTKEEWAERNQGMVKDASDALEETVTAEAARVFADVRHAYRVLVDAVGETGNANAVIADGRAEVLAAFRAWPNLVDTWREIQAVRQWVAVAGEYGFDVKRPDSLARVNTDALRRETWRAQFPGREIDADTPEAALTWFCENYGEVDQD